MGLQRVGCNFHFYFIFPGGPVVETSNAGGAFPWLGNLDPTCLMAEKQKHEKQKRYCNKFNKDFKNGPHEKKILKKKKP